jgi:hypothetical protein
VKAANGGNSYVYDPPTESLGDKTLIAPTTNAISHVEFCYDSVTVPEFPALALPVGMIIGFLGSVTFVRVKKE